MQTVYDFSATTLKGETVSLKDYAGKVLLIVNTASRCGLTPQYTGLEALYRRYEDRGFAVLGFPCNQFGKQEPGEAGEIAQFCAVNYGVSFPMFAKIEVNGAKAHPLFQFLRKALPGWIGTAIRWNFTKFLIGPDGVPVRRFAPTAEPEKLVPHIEALLPEKK